MGIYDYQDELIVSNHFSLTITCMICVHKIFRSTLAFNYSRGLKTRGGREVLLPNFFFESEQNKIKLYKNKDVGKYPKYQM